MIIKNKEGKLNVDSLKVVEEQKNAAPAEKDVKPQKAMPMQIDTMALSIGKVIFMDFETKDKPTIDAYDVGIKGKTFKNITSAQQFITLILVEAMKPTAIRGAAVYGAASVLGVAFLPAGIAATLLGDDSSSAEFAVNHDKVYKICLGFAKEKGSVASESQEKGRIKAKIDGHDVTITVIKKTPEIVEVQVSARKYMLPKQQFAGGLLYQITEKLK